MSLLHFFYFHQNTTCTNESNTGTYTDLEKLLDIGEILQICLDINHYVVDKMNLHTGLVVVVAAVVCFLLQVV